MCELQGFVYCSLEAQLIFSKLHDAISFPLKHLLHLFSSPVATTSTGQNEQLLGNITPSMNINPIQSKFIKHEIYTASAILYLDNYNTCCSSTSSLNPHRLM